MKKVLIILFMMCISLTVSLHAQQTHVTVGGIDVDTVKVFDASDTAHVRNHGTLTGIQTGHNAYPYTVAHYASIDADSNISITVTTEIHGSDSALYTLDNPTMALTGVINKRQLYRDSIILMPFKIYDGTLECPVQFSGVARNYVTHHILTTIDSCLFLDPNVGNNKPVRIFFGMNGEDEDNYLPPRDTVLESSIIKRTLVTKNTSVQTVKLYDGTADAEIISRGWFKNVVEDDTVYFNLSATYDDKNAGVGKTITTHFDIYGPDTMNYAAPDDGLYLNSEITHIQLTAQGGVADKSKEYDGTTYCNVTTPSQPVGVLEGETVYLNTMASYDDASVGNNHVITFSYTIYGNDALNYIAPEDSVYCRDGIITQESGVENVTLRVIIGPNPFTDYVDVACPANGEHHVIIYNVSGTMVQAESFDGDSARINLSSLTSGLYLFVIDGTPYKLIKE